MHLLSAAACRKFGRRAPFLPLAIAATAYLALSGGCPSDGPTDLSDPLGLQGGGWVADVYDPFGDHQTLTAFDYETATVQNQPMAVSLRAEGLSALDWDFSIVSPPAHGSVSQIRPLDQDAAAVTYTPPEDYVGQAQFSYQVSSGAVQSNVATVAITVHPEVRFDVEVIAEQPQLTVLAYAFTRTGAGLPEGTYAWQFDDYQDSGPAATHATREYVFAGGGLHVITLTLTLAGLADPVSCSTGHSGDDKEFRITSSDEAGVLAVSPSAGFESSGPQGGPFSPGGKTYELANTGDEPIDWSASKTQDWVSLSNIGGSLAAGESDTVVVSINSNANVLDPDSYTDTVTLTNTTNGVGDTTRGVALTVNATLKPIARWDTVPYQRINAGETLNVGVVAFSKAGIQEVSFAISGQGYSGPSPLDVREMSLNPQSGVWEYWVTISADDFSSDGQPTVEATVYGNDGGRRDKNTAGGGQGLDALPLNVNPNGTLPNTAVYVAVDGDDDSGDGTSGNPYATVAHAVTVVASAQDNDCGGGVIYLKPGTHVCTDGGDYHQIPAVNEYLLVTAEPGHGKTDATLVSGAGRAVNKIHFRNLTLQNTSGIVWSMTTPGCLACEMWVDDCALIGKGRDQPYPEHPLHARYKELYHTDTLITEVATAVYGKCMPGMICRNVTITAISNDAFRNVPLVINCSADDIDPLDTEAHADAWQYWGGNDVNHWDDNVIVYNYRATNCHYQGIFIRGDIESPPSHAQGMAFVNVHISGEEYFWNGWSRWVDHLLFWHCTFDKRFAFCADDYVGYGDEIAPDISDFSCKGVCFQSLRIFEGLDRNIDFSGWDENHFVEIGGSRVSRGSNYTSGDPRLDGSGRPLPDSPLLNRIGPLVVPVDASGVARSAPGSVGAYEE